MPNDPANRLSDAAFLEALKANPADDTVRLVFADWLDEHDEPQKAGYLRLVAEIARGGSWAAEHEDGPRLLALAAGLSAEWRRAAGSRFALVLESFDDNIRVQRWIQEATRDGSVEVRAACDALPFALFACVPYETATAALPVWTNRPWAEVRIAPCAAGEGDPHVYSVGLRAAIVGGRHVPEGLTQVENEAAGVVSGLLARLGRTHDREELRDLLLRGRFLILSENLTLDRARELRRSVAVLCPPHRQYRAWNFWVERQPHEQPPFRR